MTGVFGNLGIDPFYAFLILLILQVALLVVLVLVYDKYKNMEKVFNTFMIENHWRNPFLNGLTRSTKS